ncbi:MAG: hypothetical protein PVI11_01435 [Candidatus Aminicenantes bacterium]
MPDRPCRQDTQKEKEPEWERDKGPVTAAEAVQEYNSLAFNGFRGFLSGGAV